MSLKSWLLGGRKDLKTFASLPGPNAYSFDIVGESNYQTALENICSNRTFEGQNKIVQAILVPEDENPYDNKAIRVDIDGFTVGYLSRQDARQYRIRLAEAGYPGIIAGCSAIIVGGREDSTGDIGYFGVKLDLPEEEVSTSEIKEGKIASDIIFTVDKPSTNEIAETKVGDSVNFWAPADSPTEIRIYRRGSVGGTGQLGFVPNEYSIIIAKQRSHGLPIESEILKATRNTCIIGCRFIEESEVKKQEEEKKLKLHFELNKPYKPKKPVVFSIDAKRYKLQIGQRFKLIKLESIKNCENDIWGLELLFNSLDGKKNIKKTDETIVKKKIIRLIRTYGDIEFEVISQSNENNYYKSEYKLRALIE